MKKHLLIAAAFCSMNATAQQRSHTHFEPASDNAVVMPAPVVASKTTANSGPRWYATDNFYSNLLPTLSGFAIPIWFDSTVRQRFSTGYGTVNYSSVAQVIDPKGNQMWNDPSGFAGLMGILSGDQYSVDSIGIQAAYVRMPNYASVVDTLIISLAQNNLNWIWRGSQLTPTNWAAPYLPAGKDTMWGASATKVDSVNRAAFSDGTPTRILWKVPLTLSMGDPLPAGGGLTTRFYTFRPPSNFTLPPGSRVALTYTFKSGVASWNKNVDSINMFNRFMPVAIGSSARMDYHWYDLGDRSGSALMFSTDSSFYAPTVVVEATNTVGFSYEFLTAAVKLSCSTCFNVGIRNPELITVGSPYTNPSSTELHVPVMLKNSGKAHVVLTNLVGQAMMTQDLNLSAGQNGTASFNTAALPDGIYLFAVEAEGQRATGRVLVAH